jgi:nucleoside-diphosphate-sugar epimerase
MTLVASYSTGTLPVLVTGCAGFIGWKVCELLIEQGYFVIGIDNLNPRSANTFAFTASLLAQGRPVKITHTCTRRLRSFRLGGRAFPLLY